MSTINDLFFLTVGDREYYFTAAQSDVVYEGKTWISQPIEHYQSIEQSSDPLKVSSAFNVAAGSDLAQLILSPPLNEAIKIRIWRNNLADDYVAIFNGRIVSGMYNAGWIQTMLQPIYTDLLVPGLSESVTRQCRYHLGSRKCGAHVTTIRVAVSNVDGLTIELADPIALIYQFGYLQLGFESRQIDAQPDSTHLVLLHPLGIDVGEQLILTPGCDGLMSTCNGRFDNALNFGGAMHLPVKNPYMGDPINR
jgi:hypothetical protein